LNDYHPFEPCQASDFWIANGALKTRDAANQLGHLLYDDKNFGLVVLDSGGWRRGREIERLVEINLGIERQRLLIKQLVVRYLDWNWRSRGRRGALDVLGLLNLLHDGHVLFLDFKDEFRVGTEVEAHRHEQDQQCAGYRALHASLVLLPSFVQKRRPLGHGARQPGRADSSWGISGVWMPEN
jgi:hypothetical protein